MAVTTTRYAAFRLIQLHHIHHDCDPVTGAFNNHPYSLQHPIARITQVGAAMRELLRAAPAGPAETVVTPA
jgi:hypothetical protein